MKNSFIQGTRLTLLRRLLRKLVSAHPPATLSSLAAYELWAANYPPYAHNALMQAEEAAMKRLIPNLDGKRVVDLASGTGRYGIFALEQGARQVIALDNSVFMLRANKLPYRALSVANNVPLASGAIDVILCGLALGHLPELNLALNEMARILKQGGLALISDFHPFIFLNGQKRTFTSPDGQTYAVEHYAHLYADYFEAAKSAGLVLDAIIEPRLGQDTIVRFEDGKTRVGTPVIIALRFRKP